MFKLWDKQKSKGIKPMVNMALAKSVGLHNLGTLEDWAVEWYGGVDKVFQRVKEELDDKSFTTDYLEQKYGIRVGNYDFKFELTNLKLYDRNDIIREFIHGVTNQYHLWVDSVSIELI